MGIQSEKELQKIHLYMRRKECWGKISKLPLSSIKERIEKVRLIKGKLDQNTRLSLERLLHQVKFIQDEFQEKMKRDDNIPVLHIANVKGLGVTPVFWGNDE